MCGPRLNEIIYIFRLTNIILFQGRENTYLYYKGLKEYFELYYSDSIIAYPKSLVLTFLLFPLMRMRVISISQTVSREQIYLYQILNCSTDHWPVKIVIFFLGFL